MQAILGREKELSILEDAFSSKKPEFIAVYGRRRVGKTYLIRNTFMKKKNSIFFYVTGKKNGTTSSQIKHFTEELGDVFFHKGVMLQVPKNWDDAFKLLNEYIMASQKKKIVLFFDEFPWMVTRKSALLEALDIYWNHKWSRDQRIKLIICGSSAGWLLKHIINDRGGFHNRLTRKIALQPFSLKQAKEYLAHQKVKLSTKHLTHLYMVLGGIPHYLDQVKPGKTAIQIVEELAFGRQSFLMSEFMNLYASLFNEADGHIELARIIAQHPHGIGQEALADHALKIKSGTGLVSRLEDLVEAGFIERFKPFKHKKRGIFYKMADQYSIFYFHWLEPIKNALAGKGMRPGHWERVQKTPAWHSWAGYAFESICYKHIQQISTALNLSPTAIPYNWRFIPNKGSQEDGAQIDLLFDRDDDAITMCEIKYTDVPFTLDKSYAQTLVRKAHVFKIKTKTTKEIFFAMISAQGLKKNIYTEEMLSGIVTLDDLFKDAP